MNVNCSLGDHNYLAEVKADDHLIKVDEPIKMGGADRHPQSYTVLFSFFGLLHRHYYKDVCTK